MMVSLSNFIKKLLRNLPVKTLKGSSFLPDVSETDCFLKMNTHKKEHKEAYLFGCKFIYLNSYDIHLYHIPAS